MRKSIFGHVRPAKIHSCSLIGIFTWRIFDSQGCIVSSCEDNEDYDQTAQMRRLSLVFVGRTCQKVRFLTLLLCYFFFRESFSRHVFLHYYGNSDIGTYSWSAA